MLPKSQWLTLRNDNGLRLSKRDNMNIKQSQYLLGTVFHKHTAKSGTVIYWRDCVLKTDMTQGTQGYTWVFEDGETFHSYRTPEDCDI